MLVQSLLVEGVYLHRLSRSAGGNDVLGDRFDRRPLAPGEKKLGSLARSGARDSPADRASRSVNHRNLVPQHHLCNPCFGRYFHRPGTAASVPHRSNFPGLKTASVVATASASTSYAAAVMRRDVVST